ncbi:hypothetical protein [Thiomonas delicata]|uniref:Uncharacterized protein n=1 Tax=Thiomonas delicata TaxID=364030 RepID=A0A238D5G2_THIDL|nr:hypothetical protein [Thiomonas delicata]SBP88536.1 hypothetical protein THIARS_70156 [Thiomonas delicata]
MRAGQIATVKLEIFSFPRDGNLRGAARIHLDANHMWVDRHWVKLSLGMAVTVGIKTVRRNGDFSPDPQEI